MIQTSRQDEINPSLAHLKLILISPYGRRSRSTTSIEIQMDKMFVYFRLENEEKTFQTTFINATRTTATIDDADADEQCSSVIGGSGSYGGA